MWIHPNFKTDGKPPENRELIFFYLPFKTTYTKCSRSSC